MNSFATQHAQEITEILSKYPPDQKRSAVMPLLHLVQQEAGFISQQSVEEIAGIIEISSTEVASIVGYYSLFHAEPEGKYRFLVCTDLPCALRGAEEFLHELCSALNIQPGETTKDGLVTIEEVKCLAACDRAPVFQVQHRDELTYYENQTVSGALALVDELRKAEGRR
jgi:NADH-quinone oxidoreductase subunit E